MKKHTERLMPPWMKGATDINDVPMLVCHFGNGELEGLDNLQGGPSIDPETGIREYSALASIINVPQVREIFHKISNEVEEHGELTPKTHEIYEVAKHHSLPYRETPEEEHNPIHAIERQGRNGDTKLALIPLNVAEFLVELRYEPSINPKTGLLEFSKLSKAFKKATKWIGHKVPEIIRTAGTVAGGVVGTMVGGPGAGTSIGAGLGNSLAGAATGKNAKRALMGGLKVGAGTYGAHGLGQAFGLTGSTPYTAGFFGGASNPIAQGMASLGMGVQSPGVPRHLVQEAMQNMSSVPQFIQNEAAGMPSNYNPSTSGMGGFGTGAMAAHAMNQWGNSQQQRSTLDTLAQLAPLAAAGATYMAEKKKYKHDRREAQDLKDRHAKERKKMGWETEWYPVFEKEQVLNPAFFNQSYEDLMRGINPPQFIDEDVYKDIYGDRSPEDVIEEYKKGKSKFSTGGLVKSYSKGTLVRGKGKGQQDLIKTTVPDGTYIIDASSTADFGDGSSSAGASVLKGLERTVRRKYPKKVIDKVTKEVVGKAKQVPVWLSDSEYKIDPVTVTLLGKGSNKHGADLLRGMVKNLRKHKIRNGSELPPKAKDPLFYMQRRRI